MAISKKEGTRPAGVVAGSSNMVSAAVKIPPENASPVSYFRMWNACAAVVVLGLALSATLQNSLSLAAKFSTPTHTPPDFLQYYLAGRLARLKPPGYQLYYPPAGHIARSWTEFRTDAGTPYGKSSSWSDVPDGSIIAPFDAPPFAALVMEPLSLLPWRQAYLVWQLLCSLMLIGSVYLAVRLFEERPSPMIPVLAMGGVLCVLFWPFKFAQGVGNIDVLIFFLWVLGFYLLQQGRTPGSAFCFALGTAIKFSPIYAVPLLLVRRQWRWLGWYAGASLAFLGVSIWNVGLTNHVAWLQRVAPALACGIKSYYNRSLPGLIAALADPRNLATALPATSGTVLLNKVVSAAFYLGFLLWCWRRRRGHRSLRQQLALLPLVVLLVSPFAWIQYYVFSLLPLTYMWSHSRRREVPKRDLIVLVASSLIIGTDVLDYLFIQAHGAPGKLFVMAAWVFATLGLLWVGMKMDHGEKKLKLGPGFEE